MGVFSDLKPKNHANRNGFDLGRFSTFSTKAGYLNCVFHQMTLPSSEYSLDIKQLLRTEPLQKAAFAGFSINYDVIWCPYAHLYSGFNQFIAQREQKNHATQPSYMYIPTFDMYGFIKYIYCLSLYDYIVSYAINDDATGDDEQEFAGNYRLLLREEHLPSDSVALNILRQLDMMDYGNFLPVLKAHYAAIRSYYETHTIAVTIGGTSYNVYVDFTRYSRIIDDDKVGVSALFEDALGIDMDHPDLDGFVSTVYGTWCNGGISFRPVSFSSTVHQLFSKFDGVKPRLFLPLAYNKAFYEYYRNTYYDEKLRFVSPSDEEGDFNFEYDYCRLFNLDDYTPSMFENLSFNAGNIKRLIAIFAMKPHLYKRDLFTGVLPSTQFGDVSVAATDNDFHKLISNIHNSTNVNVDSGQTYVNSSLTLATRATSGTTSTVGEQFKLDPSLAISVLDLRKADAMQRFKERMLRAGSRTKDIFAAHGWSEPLSEKSYEPIFLGSFDGRLDINVVAATNEGESLELGQLGANGMATVQGHKVKIKTSDFGELFVIFHIDKDAVYDAYGLDIQHTLVEPFDYPYPELQNISLAPVDKMSLNIMDDNPGSSVLGFVPRAIYAKTAVDKVHGEFYSSLPGNCYGDTRRAQRGTTKLLVTGVFSDWVAPREDIINAKSLSFLYIQPRCTDTLFKQYANVRQDSDNFKINVRFDCYTVEPLPVIGLPI